MSTSTAVMGAAPRSRRQPEDLPKRISLDAGILAGVAIVAAAMVAGIAITGVSAGYFLQPTGLLIVVGGTCGVMLITTPRSALLLTLRRTLNLFSAADPPSREDLIEEIVAYAKVVRMKGVLAIEPEIDGVSHGFLREALQLAVCVQERYELLTALENKIRLAERQSEAAAKVLEVAGGFTPTIGVLGTVVGLIDVLRQFTSLSAVGYGVGAAFTSTIYGLGLANLVLLPAAHRIRAAAAETFDLQELMMEGALCLFDGMHPRMVRQRLHSFLHGVPDADRSLRTVESAAEAGRV
jgi:chemotaxis protein MotA